MCTDFSKDIYFFLTAHMFQELSAEPQNALAFSEEQSLFVQAGLVLPSCQNFTKVKEKE